MLEPNEKKFKYWKFWFQTPTQRTNKLIVSSIIKEEVHNSGLNPGPFVVPGSQKGP
jgi:hypothetical protein